MLRTTLPIILLLSSPAPCPAQEAAPPDIRRAVGQSISDGIGALLAQQELDGSWRAHQEGYAAGQTAFCVYALLKCGTPSDHQAIQRALEYLRSHPSSKTYCMAVLLLALCELDAEEHEDWIEELAEELMSRQRSGGFAYPDGDVDLSNTQYATLGLRAAVQAGFKIPGRTWERLVDCALNHQDDGADGDEPAGFYYRRDSYTTGSMTTAGITILAVAREMGAGGRQLEQALGSGVAWLAREISVEVNPRREPDYQYYYYWMYGLERVAGLLGLEQIGGVDWYRAGCEVLLAKQNERGRWGGQHETCFALLFLARATAPVSGPGSTSGIQSYVTKTAGAEVVLRATGDTPLTLWVDSFARPGELEWEGDEGQGPRVIGVSYECIEDGQPARVIALAPGDGARPSAGERYAVQHSFATPGKRSLVAVVAVRPRGASDEVLELRSAPLDVMISQAWNEELVAYASDPERNLLAGLRVEVEASSQLSDAFSAQRTVDNRQASAWLSADTEATPWLRLELNKPVKADHLVLSHTFNPADPDVARPSRVRRVALFVNNSKTPIEFEMHSNDWRKTAVPLGKALKVRALELRVLEVEVGGAQKLGVGFAEVELQLRR